MTTAAGLPTDERAARDCGRARHLAQELIAELVGKFEGQATVARLMGTDQGSISRALNWAEGRRGMRSDYCPPAQGLLLLRLALGFAAEAAVPGVNQLLDGCGYQVVPEAVAMAGRGEDMVADLAAAEEGAMALFVLLTRGMRCAAITAETATAALALADRAALAMERLRADVRAAVVSG